MAAAQRDSRLDELDQALHEQVLEQIGVLLLIVLEALGHLDASFSLQALHEFVGALHAIDTRFICGLRFLNLQVALSDLQVLEHLIVQALLLGLDHLLGLHGEVCLHLLLDLGDALAALLLDELDHASHNASLLCGVHL